MGIVHYSGAQKGGRMIRLLFLGSGTSYGVPVIGCDCEVCRADDPRDKRTRASALLRVGERSILIDSATDLRAQALRNDIRRVDAILFTHSHADHLHGIDDLRRFSALQRAAIPAYGDSGTLEHIRKSHAYIFTDPEFRLGWGIPRLTLQTIEKPAEICGTTVTPVPILHGDRTILGYRLDGLAYLTDCSGLPDDSLPLLEGVDTLVVDALRHKPHATHLSLSEALEVVARLRPRRAYFTHISHDLGHAATEDDLPENIRLAYDGLEIAVPTEDG